MTRRDEPGELSSRASDRFEEETPVGLDQLLMIRLAQQLGAAPDKLRGGEGEQISNQRPIAEKAAQHFSEDIRRFVRVLRGIIPRHAFVELLESCMAVGMTTILTSVIEILFEWAETGEIRKKCEQRPAFLFVDCSNGVDRRLRALAEQSMDDFMRRIERFPVILMALRLLDRGARYDPRSRRSTSQPDPMPPSGLTCWANCFMIGDERQSRSSTIWTARRRSWQRSLRTTTLSPHRCCGTTEASPIRFGVSLSRSPLCRAERILRAT